jgi:hypothetical protein
MCHLVSNKPPGYTMGLEDKVNFFSAFLFCEKEWQELEQKKGMRCRGRRS